MKTSVNVLAVDPGKTVGIAVYSDGKFSSLELPRPDAVPYIGGLMDGFYDGTPDGLYVVIERFYKGVRGPVRTFETDATDVTALVEQMCDDRDMRHVRQSPSDAKTVCTDKWLKWIGWWNPGHGHANDAARHVKLALMRHFKDEFARVWRGDTIELNRVKEDEEVDAPRRT